MPLYALLLALSVGGEPAAGQDTPLEVHDGVKVTPEQVQEVKTKAAQAFSGEIERIYVGQLVHPYRNKGFRVHFKDEIVETYVIERQFVLEIAPANRANRDPAKAKDASWKNLLDPARVPHGLLTSVKRLFPLKTTQLHLRLPDALSYSQAMALLQAIESRTYRVLPETPNTRKGWNRNAPIDTSKITSLQYDEKAKTIEVSTSSWPTGGKCYTFAVLPDGFELLLVSSWVS